MSEVNAIIASSEEILRSLDQFDSRYLQYGEAEKKEIMNIAILSLRDQRLAKEWIRGKGKDFADELVAIKLEYERIRKKMKKFDLKLPGTKYYRILGIRGLIFQIMIGCIQTIAFLNEWRNNEQPKAKLV